MPTPGDVWSHASFYRHDETNEPLRKFLLILALRADGDVVYRLLTSRQHGRPTNPTCFHGAPYPGFYLGVPMVGGLIGCETWLDLREMEDDFDAVHFRQLAVAGVLTLVHTMLGREFCSSLSCAANAQDTTKRQRNAILDARQSLNCQ